MTLYVGDDWSEDHHDVQLMNEAGEQLAARRRPEGVGGSVTPGLCRSYAFSCGWEVR